MWCLAGRHPVSAVAVLLSFALAAPVGVVAQVSMGPAGWSWRELPPAPFGSSYPFVANTGDGLLVVDPATGHTAGFDVQDGVWTVGTTAPVVFPPTAAHGWTGDELLVAGGGDTGDLVYGYAPATDTWSSLAPAPLAEMTTAAWTGEVWVAGSSDGRLAAYDPAEDGWSGLPAAPGARRLGSLHWTGSDLLAVTHGAEKTNVRVAAFDPATASWGDPVVGPVSGLYPGSQWTGEQLLFLHGPDGSGPRVSNATYDPVARSWSEVNNPCDVYTGRSGWTGRYLVDVYHLTAFDVDAGTCSELPEPAAVRDFTYDGERSGFKAAVVDGELIFWGGGFEEGNPLPLDGISLRIPAE